MANIAVICEGVSEFNIINYIASRYKEGLFLNAVQPKINPAKGTQDDDGGWSRVLDHCTDKIINEIFQLNDYLIIQIDTDSSHISPYDVKQENKDGTKKTYKRLHAEIKARLMRDISHETRKKYLNRIIFAICHNEIECWLLPVYFTDNKACKTNNCIYLLNGELLKRDVPPIPDKKKNSPNAQKAYRQILKNIRKKSEVIRIAKYSHGFYNFILGLDTI